jgi:CPA2 family monovalent cation:H+ antiporter-2
MPFDPAYALTHVWEVVTIVVAIAVGKALICGSLARLFGYRNLAPWIVGLGLSQIGEFSFVLARAGRAGGSLGDDTYNLALTCTVISMALSPAFFPGLVPVARTWAGRRHPSEVPVTELGIQALENHVVVAGFGRTGQAVVDALRRSSVPCVVIDLHHETVAKALEEGIPAVWGDVAHEDILRAAGIIQARMLVLAVPEWKAIRIGVERATSINPRVFVIARATGTKQVKDLRALRIDAAVQPEFEGGIEMVRRALKQLDRSDDDIEGVAGELRRTLYESDAPTPSS